MIARLLQQQLKERLSSSTKIIILYGSRQVGKTTLAKELIKELPYKTVARYIDLLEKAFVIFRLSGFSRNLRKEIVKMDKVFFYDIGIRNAIVENFNELAHRNDTGQLWENFLISERIKSTTYHRQPGNRYFWRTYTGAALDYVEEREGQLYGFKFKWGKKTAKAPRSWLETYPEANFRLINRESYLNFLQVRD